MTRRVVFSLFACACCLTTHAAASGPLQLWGLDAHDTQLFSIDDLHNPQGTLTDFGTIHVPDGDSISPVPGGVRAFTVVNTFDAYAVVNADVGELAAPVLIHLDLREIEPGIPAVGEPLASLDGIAPGWAVTGIAGDPLFGVMHLVLADGDPTTNDRIARATVDAERVSRVEPLGQLRWRSGGITMSSDVTMGPAGLLLVADDEHGRVVMVDPDTGAVRGVRIEGIRVDTDTARYAGIAWDGLHDRIAMFDARRAELVIDDRAANTVSVFDLAQAGVVDAEGLAFVLRPDPPGGAAEAAGPPGARVSNITNPERHGSRAGVRPTPGGSGGGNPFDLSDLLDDPPDDPLEDPLDEPGDDDLAGGIDPPADDPAGDDLPPDITGDPTDDPPSDEPAIPAPAGFAVLGAGLAAASRRRRAA